MSNYLGQRVYIRYANGVASDYEYDKVWIGQGGPAFPLVFLAYLLAGQ